MTNYREAPRKLGSTLANIDAALVDRLGLANKIVTAAPGPNNFAGKICELQCVSKSKPTYGGRFRVVAALTGSIQIAAIIIAGFAAMVAVDRVYSAKIGNLNAGAFGTRLMSDPISIRTPAHVEVGSSSNIVFAKQASARDEALANRGHWIFRPPLFFSAAVYRIDGGPAKGAKRSPSQRPS